MEVSARDVASDGGSRDDARTMRGADAVIDSLIRANLDIAFGLPGVHNQALWRAAASRDFRIVGSRHEQGCAYAADGMARSTGRVGVVFTTTGPGAANTVCAVGEAWASRSAVVVIASDIPSSMRREGNYRGVLHECTDQAALFRPVTKQTITVDSADAIASTIAQAVEIALTPSEGPVYVQIPTDFLAATVVTGSTPLIASRPSPIATPAWLDRAQTLVSGAERPLIWVGGGGRRAGAAIAGLATTLQAPVVTTVHARNVLPLGHPLMVEVPSHEPPVTDLVRRADLAIIVGSDLDAMSTQGWSLPLPATRIALNIDPEDAVKNYSATLAVAGDASDLVASLADALPARAKCWADPPALRREVLRELAAEPTTADAALFLRSTERALPRDAVIFADFAICGYWLASYHPVAHPRAVSHPLGWGTLGFGFPASIGAAAVLDEPVVSFCGDGGMLFAVGELATVAQENLPLTIVVVDDEGYGMLRYGNEDNPWGTRLHSPDFAALARSFGIEARTVDGVGDDYADALAEGVARRAPFLLHVKASLIPPRTTTPRWPLREAAR